MIFLWQQKKLKMKIRLAGAAGRSAFHGCSGSHQQPGNACGLSLLYTWGHLPVFAWARLAWGSIFTAILQELISLIVWALYALLFHQRQALGWQGRKPALVPADGHLRSFTFLPACGQFSAAYTPCVPDSPSDCPQSCISSMIPFISSGWVRHCSGQSAEPLP